LSLAADQFADDIITGTQLKRISIRLREERASAERQLRRATPDASLAELTRGDVRAVWGSMPMQSKRDVVSALINVTIHPSGSGRSFDPELIAIEWKQT
jgi:hypothetical protein